jgi:Inner membrane protein YgaP-like, transmembrane domain
MKKKNVGTIERVGRIALGGGLAVWAAVLLLGAAGLISLLLYFALVVLGLDFVVTGIRGYCPLYNLLGWSTVQPKPQS